MKKTLTYITLTFFALVCTYAQRPVKKYSPWDIRLVGSLGQTAIAANSEYNISTKPGSFYGGGVQADYIINKTFGLGFGLEYNSLTAQLALANYSATVLGTDKWEGDPTPRPYEFYIATNNTDVVDEVSITQVDLPLYVFYKIPLKKNVSIDIRGGLRFSFPTQSSYQLTSSNLTTQLYFEGVVLSPDGRERFEVKRTGDLNDAVQLGREAAEELIALGASAVLSK